LQICGQGSPKLLIGKMDLLLVFLFEPVSLSQGS
jgi:hypothetical protein